MSKRTLVLLAIPCSLLFISSTIDLNNLLNYADQGFPEYIQNDNTFGNPVTDAGATLGRVLFYDKNLSANLAVSCASCHQQSFGFSDPLPLSEGLDGGLTGRSSMRLINARFSAEPRFFWDERADNLEIQTTQPIQDHIEMGFSGTMGNPDFGDLIERLEDLTYYQDLFNFVYGDADITEERIQLALAQFIRSIQSFDSRFDEGLAQVNNLGQPFPNFTQQENMGKMLYLQPPGQGGAGCQGCHQAPEFSISLISRNNGVIGVAGSDEEIDLTNTRAPSLRDLFNPDGVLNGPMMHNGAFTTLLQVINHYDSITLNPNLDPRLTQPNGQGQDLNLTESEKAAIAAFLRTLTGHNVYEDERWSDPFGTNGALEILGGPVQTGEVARGGASLAVYPNPAGEMVNLKADGEFIVTILNLNGQTMGEYWFSGQTSVRIDHLPSGTYLIRLVTTDGTRSMVRKLVKR